MKQLPTLDRKTMQRALFGIALFAASSSIDAGESQQESLVTLQGEQTIESFIEHLPTAMRNNYVLVFQSRSIQDATRANPRVILFSPDAHFVVTFNGEPSQRGYDDVEVMRFDPV